MLLRLASSVRWARAAERSQVPEVIGIATIGKGVHVMHLEAARSSAVDAATVARVGGVRAIAA